MGKKGLIMRFETKNPLASKIKDEIQAALMQVPMTPKEIQMKFKLDKAETVNYITSLKKQNLIAWHEDFNTGTVRNRKYIAFYGKPKFSEIIEQRMSEGQKIVARKNSEKAEVRHEAKKNPHATIITVNDYHTKGNVSHKHEWRGYSSMAGL
jgi:metal-sulfur cluster biosynthetic enzyme